jgi:hypothetical protein
MQPGCSPSPMVIQDDDHQLRGGEKQAGLRPLPRPQLQGCSSSVLGRGVRRVGACLRVGQRPDSSSSIRGRRASSSPTEVTSSSHAGEGELLLPGQGAAVRPPPRRRSRRAQVAAVTVPVDGGGLRQRGSGRRQASSALVCLSCWLSWLWHRLRRCLLPLGLCGSRRWPIYEDLSGDLPTQAGVAAIRRRGAGAQVAAVVGAEVVAAGGGCLHRRDRRRHRRSDLRLFGFDDLSSPLVWGHGRVLSHSSGFPEVIAAAV